MSKGSTRRPGVMPAANWDAIFKPAPPQPFCDLHKMSISKCGCMPTNDGPGQEEDKLPYDQRRFDREGV